MRPWLSVQPVLQLLLLLFPLCKPPLDLLFKLCVWSDLVHSEGAPIERIRLVTERQSIEEITGRVLALEIKKEEDRPGRVIREVKRIPKKYQGTRPVLRT